MRCELGFGEPLLVYRINDYLFFVKQTSLSGQTKRSGIKIIDQSAGPFGQKKKKKKKTRTKADVRTLQFVFYNSSRILKIVFIEYDDKTLGCYDR